MLATKIFTVFSFVSWMLLPVSHARISQGLDKRNVGFELFNLMLYLLGNLKTSRDVPTWVINKSALSHDYTLSMFLPLLNSAMNKHLYVNKHCFCLT